MLELQSFIKNLPRARRSESDQNGDTFLVGKYKSPEEIAIILNRLQPTSQTIQGLSVHHAPGIFESFDNDPYHSFPYTLLASESGQQLLKDKDFFAQLEQNPAHLPGAKEVIGDFHSRVFRVPYPPLKKTLYIKIAQQIGRELYKAIGMMLLRSLGFHTPNYPITTQSRSVTEQAEGKDLSLISIDPNLEELVEKRMQLFRNLVNGAMHGLTEKGLWLPPNRGSGYGLSLHNKSHFFISDWDAFLNTNNPDELKNSVTIVDGVTFQTNNINSLFAH